MKKPNCPNCKISDFVVNSIALAHGNHYCVGCHKWFSVAADTFRAEFERRFPSISYDFIAAMDEIGKLGRDKYADDAIECRIRRGDRSRFSKRIYAREIARHSANHFDEYIDGILHDVYHTRKHQLAAAAFNPMMEFELAALGAEEATPSAEPSAAGASQH